MAAHLLPGAAHDVEVHIQGLVPEELRRPEQDGEAGAVVHGLAADLAVHEVEAAAPEDHGGADGDPALRLLLAQTHVHPELIDGDGLLFVLRLEHMGRQAGHHAQHGGVGEYGELPVGQHPGVHPADGAEAEEALLDAGDDEADLIQMGVQQQPGGAGAAAQPHPHRIAEPVHVGLIQEGPHQVGGLHGHRPLKAGGSGHGAQAAQDFSRIQIFHSFPRKDRVLSLRDSKLVDDLLEGLAPLGEVLEVVKGGAGG